VRAAWSSAAFGAAAVTGTRLADSRAVAHDARAQSELLIGQTLEGRYHLLEHIGSGGMSSVYRACQLNVGRDVAVKILNSILLTNPNAATRFEVEARVISRLHHPNTLKLIDYGKLPDGRPFLVTEFLVGSTLECRIARRPLDPIWVLMIIRQICDAMAEAHDQQIVHRDLKPGNIFLERVGGEEIVRVLDFGIAKLGDKDTTKITASGAVCGTPCYMSPEQAAGDPLDPRSDLYSLGVIAYECLAGSPPFFAPEPAGILLMHLTEPPVPLSEIMPQIDHGITSLVMQLLEKDPGARPQSARDVRARIDRLLSNVSARRESSSDSVERRAPLRRASPVLTLATTVAGAGPTQSVGLRSTLFSSERAPFRAAGVALLAVAFVIVVASWVFFIGGAKIITRGQTVLVPIAEAPPLPPPEAPARETGDEVVLGSAAIAPKPSQRSSSPIKTSSARKVPIEKGFVDFDLN
jgi:eukaryotic-like serine/threonine-protein kinase